MTAVEPRPAPAAHAAPDIGAWAYFEGAVVPRRSDDPNGRGLEVLMGLRVNAQGQFGFRHAVVDYRIGGRRHSVRVNDGFIACAPVDAFPPGCHLTTFFGEREKGD